MTLVSRRQFLAASAVGAATLMAPRPASAAAKAVSFQISLAQWSLHRAFGRRKETPATLDPKDFARIAHQTYGLNAVEYVNQFYAKFKNDDGYVKELKTRADDTGVRSVLIMCDGEGNLGDKAEAKRKQAVQNHVRWLEWAKVLGCHSIRVNAYSEGTREEQSDRAADGLRQLSELAAPMGLNVIVENHGGFSSDGSWLAGVMTKVNLKNCGTLPDFGNFSLGGGKDYDRYQGVDEMMPFARGVSAKTYDFGPDGNETKIDYKKMLEIVLVKHKYTGFVGIEYEGNRLSEDEGIKASLKLLERLREEMGN